MFKIKLKGRLILTGIIFIISCVMLIFFIGFEYIEIIFLISIGMSIFFFFLTSPAVDKWDKDRIERRSKRDRIYEEERLKEKARLDAQEEHKNKGYQPPTLLDIEDKLHKASKEVEKRSRKFFR